MRTEPLVDGKLDRLTSTSQALIQHFCLWYAFEQYSWSVICLCVTTKGNLTRWALSWKTLNLRNTRALIKINCSLKILTWRKLAISSLAVSRLFVSSSFFNLSSNVEGSIPGKILRATGSKSSMKGTSTKTAIGTSLKTSAVVLVSCLFSLLQEWVVSNLSDSGHHTIKIEDHCVCSV